MARMMSVWGGDGNDWRVAKTRNRKSTRHYKAVSGSHTVAVGGGRARSVGAARWVLLVRAARACLLTCGLFVSAEGVFLFRTGLDLVACVCDVVDAAGCRCVQMYVQCAVS